MGGYPDPNASKHLSTTEGRISFVIIHVAGVITRAPQRLDFSNLYPKAIKAFLVSLIIGHAATPTGSGKSL